MEELDAEVQPLNKLHPKGGLSLVKTRLSL